MDLPADVLVHNQVLGLKGAKAQLVRIAPEGYYEVTLSFGERRHRTFLPVEQTVIIFREPEEQVDSEEFEIER